MGKRHLSFREKHKNSTSFLQKEHVQMGFCFALTLGVLCRKLCLMYVTRVHHLSKHV